MNIYSHFGRYIAILKIRILVLRTERPNGVMQEILATDSWISIRSELLRLQLTLKGVIKYELECQEIKLDLANSASSQKQ